MAQNRPSVPRTGRPDGGPHASPGAGEDVARSRQFEWLARAGLVAAA